jgi:uncharacterized membrane protein
MATAQPGPAKGVLEHLRQVLITGFAITLPLLVTLGIVAFVLNFASGLLDGVVGFLKTTYGLDLPDFAVELLTVSALVLVVFVIGQVAELRSGSGIENTFDTVMARIPGIGQVYTSFNEMSELLLSNDSQSFREVKLVEFPTEGSYAIAFVTADTPATFSDATGDDELVTLFMPMAPNPVMGGHVIHVSTERVYDVDIGVDAGIRSIVTSGVALGETDTNAQQSLIDLEQLRANTPDELADITPGADDGGDTGSGDGSGR